MQTGKALIKNVVNDIRFLKGWVKQPKATGSITPTGKAAAELMASLIPVTSSSRVLELGPGTGVITKAIIDRGIGPENIVSVERNCDFLTHLQKTYPQVQFLNGDAFNLEEALKGTDEKFAAVLSGIPLLNFSKFDREKLLLGALDRLEDGAPFVQLCYGPKAPVKPIPGNFSAKPTRWVLSNVPPARYWVYRKDHKTRT